MLSAALTLASAPPSSEAQSPGDAPPPPTQASAKEGPQRLKQEKRITAEAKASPEAAEAGESVPAAKSFEWKFQWEGWNGMNIGISQKTRIENPFTDLQTRLAGTNAHTEFHLEELKMSGKIGAKLALDAADYATSDDIEGFHGGVELRRARIFAKGECLLILPVSYQLELGYIPNEFYIEESYLAFMDLRYIGQLKFGQYQAPMGLDVISSSRDIAFMEPAAPLQALAPGVNAGVQMGRPVLGKRATWTFGLFTDGVGQDFGDASRDYGRAIIRLTGLPIDRQLRDPSEATASSDRSHLLHVGLSANVLYSANSTVRYQARPESHLAPHVIDTGDIESQGAWVLGAEAAWVNGPFSVQGELLHSFVEQAAGVNLNFQGIYGSASWFFTGESRPYNRTDGCFGRVIPKHNFNWGQGGWGAWEVSGRYSFVDLNDGGIAGGRLRMIMAGLNWYPHSHVKWRINYGFGRVSDHAPDGNLNIFQTRVEVDF